MNGLFNKLIAVPIILILISGYLLGVNFYNKIDRVNDIKDAVPQSSQTEAAKTAEQEDKELNDIQDKININNATESELQSLDGIGEKLAKRIIDKRESIGGYTDVEQLLEVEGIGDKIFEQIKNYVTVE